MTTRSKTNAFLELRVKCKSTRAGRTIDHTTLRLDEYDLAATATPRHTADVELPHIDTEQLPPMWVDIVEQITETLARVQDSIVRLQDMQTERLRVRFGDDGEAEANKQERDIEHLTVTIQNDFKDAEGRLKRIASVGDSKKLTVQERQVRLNVMRSLAERLQLQTKTYRTVQKKFVQRLNQLEDAGSEYFEDGDEKNGMTSAALHAGVESGFTSEQVRKLDEMEKTATQRELEIIRVCQTVNELANMFGELNLLIIEQGSIVDRIDYNVERSLTAMKQGNVELTAANEYQKKSSMRSNICIAVLLIILAILIAILSARASDDGGSDNGGN